MKIEIELRPQDAWLKRKTEADIESGDINNIVRKLLRQHYTRLDLSAAQEYEAELFDQWLAGIKKASRNGSVDIRAAQVSWHDYLAQRGFTPGALLPASFAMLLEDHGASVDYLETIEGGRTPYAVAFVL